MSSDKQLFDVIKQIQSHNVEYFNDFTAEDNKQFHPFVIQRWLTGTDTNPIQIDLINTYSNPNVFSVSHHHRLLSWYVLLAVCGGDRSRVRWIKNQKPTSNKPTTVSVLRQTYGYSEKEAIDSLNCLDFDGAIELATDLGLEEAEITKIRKEYGITNSRKKNSI